jgi:rod shape-determining protein MreC
MLRLLNLLKYSKGLMLFFLLALGAVIFLAFPDSGLVRSVKSFSLSTLSFPLRALSWSVGLGSRSAEYRELQKTCLKLALETNYLKEMEKENIRLRRLLHFKEKSRFNFFPVEVIGRDPDLVDNSIIIQGGKNVGLTTDMPAVVAEGLVGKVVDVGWNSAVVQLLLDQNARVSAIVQRSREQGIVEWSGGNQGCLKNVEKRDDVKVGDLVITSGMGGVYPKGITIGTVQDINTSRPGLFQDILVDLSVDFSYLEEIFILVKE